MAPSWPECRLRMRMRVGEGIGRSACAPYLCSAVEREHPHAIVRQERGRVLRQMSSHVRAFVQPPEPGPEDDQVPDARLPGDGKHVQRGDGINVAQALRRCGEWFGGTGPQGLWQALMVA